MTSQKTPKGHSAIETVRLQCLSKSWLVWSWTYQLTMTPNHRGWRAERKQWQISRGHWLHSKHLPESSLLELGEGVYLHQQQLNKMFNEKTITLRRHSPLFRAARNQLTSFSGKVTCWRLDGLTSIKLVLSWPWGAETIPIIVSRILLWMSSVILPTSLVLQTIVVPKEAEL